MTFDVLWVGLAAAGIFLPDQRAGFAWFPIACVIWPVLAGTLVLVMKSAKKEADTTGELAKAKDRME